MKKSISMGKLEEGGVGQAHMFVLDKLTSGSPPTGMQGASLLQNKMGGGAGQLGPSSKFDAQTGKFYRSFRVDTAEIEGAQLKELLGLFALNGLDYDEGQHSGVMMSVAGGALSVICVGDTHVHCNFLFEKSRAKVDNFLTLHAAANQVEEQLVAAESCGLTFFHSLAEPEQEDDTEFAGKAHCMAGFTLFSAGPAHSPAPATEKADQVAGQTLFSPLEPVEPCELAAEESAGITFFRPHGKVKDHMVADSVAGFTLLSYADDTLSEQSTEDGGSNVDAQELAEADAALSNKDLKALWTSVAETCAGLTFFSRPVRTEEEWDAMQADSCGGITLFA
jgi:hypothetical protein